MSALFEFSHPDFAGERLMACRNVEGKLRAHKREALLQATERELEKIRARVVIGDGPRFRKLGRRVAYAIVDLELWANVRSCDSTSDPSYDLAR